MEIKELRGEHLLTGVETDMEDIEIYGVQQCVNVIKFTLDDRTYKASEDPDDGYRSMMNSLEVTDELLLNRFAPQRVLGIMKANDMYENNVIQFYNIDNGKLLLEVGTADCNDYYPYFVRGWSPQHLTVNA